MPISRLASAALTALASVAILSGCRAEPDSAVLAAAEAKQTRDAGVDGRIACALDGAQLFRIDCTLDRIASAPGTIIVVGRADSGYRRLRITHDGSGVATADGAQQAQVSIIDDGLIEVSVGRDRYHLPAKIGGS